MWVRRCVLFVRKSIWILIFCPAILHAQDFRKVVLPLTDVKVRGVGVEGDFGTGFCLDTDCRFIGTNYHVAVMAKRHKINGQSVINVFLATGPEDEGATLNRTASGISERYTLERDLAVFELRHPLAHRHGGTYSLRDLVDGQKVDIFAYPKGPVNPVRNLVQFHALYKGTTTSGLLAFDYTPSGTKRISGGASGGLVVDSETRRIVGVLSGVENNGDNIALAVPIQSLADFVYKVEPWLAEYLFPAGSAGVSAASADYYPKFVAQPSSGALEHRPEEPESVKLLRAKAQTLADSIRNFVAVQSFAWGSGGEEAPLAEAAYEVQVVDGYQRFRRFPDGMKELNDVPFPALSTAMRPGGEWSELPQMVGTGLRLKIHKADDVTVNGRQIRVFQYRADAEDRICEWESVLDFGFFAFDRTKSVPCYGEVWTDEDSNILRISEHLDITGRWRAYTAVVTYGWLRRKYEAPRLVPLTISSQAEHGRKVYWCRGLFTDYKVFTTQAKILAGNYHNLP